MKQKFEPAEVEIIRFDIEDVITASNICEWEGPEL